MPCSTSASRGPPATTTVKTPCIRPRISSVAADSRMAPRNTIDTMSATPAAARNATAIHRFVLRPKPATATPQAATAPRTMSPWCRAREKVPEKSPPSTAPIGMAANSRPRARPSPYGAKVCAASSGNRARGMPNTIAMMSARNDSSSTLCRAM